MVTKKLKIVSLIVLLLSISCENKKSEVATPSVILSESQMVEIITDVQIIENAINLRRGRSQKVINLKTYAFDEIFSHYNITDSIFYENMNYYNDNPVIMKRIIDSVNMNFQRMQDERVTKKENS